jgi:prevent-host-death family protein
MKTLELSQATAPLSQYADGLDREPIILTVDGKPIAALISIQESDWESLSLSTNPQFIQLIEHSRARQSAEGGVSSKEMRQRLGVK